MLRFPGRVLLCAAASSTTAPSVKRMMEAQQNKLDHLSPQKITEILDSYIVGQKDGKRAVAISLRNRWRRRQLASEDLRKEVVPKNMLLVGPTGVGKTEISRRMARITDAPFVKVEATKYTEVGFKGKDVESIIEDLYTNAKAKAKRVLSDDYHQEALEMAIDYVYSAWRSQKALKKMQEKTTHKSSAKETDTDDGDEGENEGEEGEKGHRERKSRKASSSNSSSGDADKESNENDELSLEWFSKEYTNTLKDETVTISVAIQEQPQKNSLLGDLLLPLTTGGAPRQRMVTNRLEEAVALARQDNLDKLIGEGSINTLAKSLAEDEGIVFIDEIDKVVAEPGSANADVSSTGVQQDLLPLVEGSNVTMKDGTSIATDNILFICSGAFHTAKTSDMIAELQGRLPVRVELSPLTQKDFRRILTEPKYNLLIQQKEMLKTENIDVVFTEDAIDELARVTTVINTQGQNIGARRLHTVMEHVMDPYSFGCEDYEGKTVTIDAKVVKEATEKLQKNVNLAKYLL